MPTTRSTRRKLQVREIIDDAAASADSSKQVKDFFALEKMKRKSGAHAPDDLTIAATPAKRPASGEKKLHTPGLLDAEDQPDHHPAYPRHHLGADFESTEEETHVPHYLYKNLQYRREGETQLSTGARKAFNAIKVHYIVPQNFETSRLYGPWSGTCYEERLMSAYEVSQLQPKAETVELCCFCGEIGHLKRDCPDLL